MSRMPSARTADPPKNDPRVVGVDSEDADAVLGALSSGTARAMLGALHEEPRTPSELAASVDTTLQNAQYHLGKLTDAGLVGVHDTAYSVKGREMTVYAPADRPLVLFAGREDDGDTVRDALGRLFGALAVLALGSVLVQWLLARGGTQRTTFAASVETAPEPTGPLGALLNAVHAAPPGVVFFAGGLLVLGVLYALGVARRSR